MFRQIVVMAFILSSVSDAFYCYNKWKCKREGFIVICPTADLVQQYTSCVETRFNRLTPDNDKYQVTENAIDDGRLEASYRCYDESVCSMDLKNAYIVRCKKKKALKHYKKCLKKRLSALPAGSEQRAVTQQALNSASLGSAAHADDAQVIDDFDDHQDYETFDAAQAEDGDEDVIDDDGYDGYDDYDDMLQYEVPAVDQNEFTPRQMAEIAMLLGLIGTLSGFIACFCQFMACRRKMGIGSKLHRYDYLENEEVL